MLQTLLAAGADIDHQTDDGSTALYVASSKGYRGVIHDLLAGGADAERHWLDDYHKSVHDDVAPLVDDDTAAWLAEVTRAIDKPIQ